MTSDVTFKSMLSACVGLALVGCGNSKEDDASLETSPGDSGSELVEDTGSQPETDDCSPGGPSAGLTATVTADGDAFSGQEWTCTVTDVVDPLGDGVTVAIQNSYGAVEVVSESDSHQTVVVPFPEEVSENDYWGLFEWTGCRVTLVDSAGCSTDILGEGGGWFDPRTPAEVEVFRLSEEWLGISYDSDPPTGPWTLEFHWFVNGEAREGHSSGALSTEGLSAGDVARVEIVWESDEGIRLVGEDSFEL